MWIVSELLVLHQFLGDVFIMFFPWNWE